MRICDRCQAAATDRITFESTDEKIDLCDSCSYDIRELAGTPKDGLLKLLKNKVKDLTKPAKTDNIRKG
jgi:ribosomal protein L37AE/L43A